MRHNHPLPPRIHPLSRKRCSTGIGRKKKIAKAGQVTRMEESNVKTVSPKHRKVSLCAFRFVYRETKHEPETGKCFLSVYIGWTSVFVPVIVYFSITSRVFVKINIFFFFSFSFYSKCNLIFFLLEIFASKITSNKNNKKIIKRNCITVITLR